MIVLSRLIADVYERTLSVDGEDTTLVVMDTWEAEKLVRHCKPGKMRDANLIVDACLLVHAEQGLGQGPVSPLPQTYTFS